MDYKKIIPFINAENEVESSVVKKAADYEKCGADELYIYNYSSNEKEYEEFLALVKKIVKSVGIPVITGVYVKRFEDVKKAFYTGAKAVVISYAKLENKAVIKESADRFGKENIILELDCDPEKNDGLFKSDEDMENILSLGQGNILLKHVSLTDTVKEKIAKTGMPVYIRDGLLRNSCENLIGIKNVTGVSTNYYENKDIMKIKHMLKAAGISTNVFESSIEFKNFKKNADGLVPVVVQDYKTNEVLMLAYMNEESYNKTIETGVMTYYSRSRSELWIKGETSGHYQYVRAMYADCDTDTILAKVMQVGAACHTGERSCFFNELVKKEYDDTNPLTVFNDVYATIADRKANPKEGSYTNYLFDKGIDKILKKCGEESAEIIIAAKNPDKEEIKYEIADYLYHLMVLMAECGVDWEDITKELAHRR